MLKNRRASCSKKYREVRKKRWEVSKYALLQSRDLSQEILPESVVTLKFCKPYVKDKCSWKIRAKSMVFYKENRCKIFLSLWLLKIESLCAYKFQTDMLILFVDVIVRDCFWNAPRNQWRLQGGDSNKANFVHTVSSSCLWCIHTISVSSMAHSTPVHQWDQKRQKTQDKK